MSINSSEIQIANSFKFYFILLSQNTVDMSRIKI